jgi:hypothetical protein
VRRAAIAILAAGAVSVSGSACGAGTATPAGRPRPPAPVNLAVYVNDARVSASPMILGAGPVVFVVTNQASHAESLAISRAGHGNPLASTSPINPQATTQVLVNLRPGDYTIATGPRRATDATLAQRSTIHPASIHIGPPRSNSDNALLQP